MKLLRALAPTLAPARWPRPRRAPRERDFPRELPLGHRDRRPAGRGRRAARRTPTRAATGGSGAATRRTSRRGWVTGDLIERGPGHWRLFRKDIDLAAERLRSNAFRFSIEWSRVFPRSTAGVRVGRRIDLGDLRRLDRLANHAALRHYAAELRVSGPARARAVRDGQPLRAAHLDPRPDRGARRAGRPRAGRARSRGSRAAAGSSSVDRARVPQVRRLPRLEARARA